MPGLITAPVQVAMLDGFKTLLDIDTIKVALYTDIVGVGRPTKKGDFTIATGGNLGLKAPSVWGADFNRPNNGKASISDAVSFDGTGLTATVAALGVVVIGGGADADTDPVYAWYPFSESKLINDGGDVVNVVLQIRCPRDEDYFSVDLIEGDS